MPIMQDFVGWCWLIALQLSLLSYGLWHKRNVKGSNFTWQSIFIVVPEPLRTNVFVAHNFVV